MKPKVLHICDTSLCLPPITIGHAVVIPCACARDKVINCIVIVSTKIAIS